MYIVTSAEMRALDEYAIHTIGIPAAVLMENAGRAVAEEVAKLSSELGDLGASKPWLILVGKGNNGGDGIVAARHLKEMGVSAELLYAADPAKLTSDAALQRDIAVRMGIAASLYGTGSIRWEEYAGIVDALLGTGTAGAPREPYASIIREANASGLPLVAVDIPSGIDADTGEAHDPSIHADMTVALAFLKRGLTQYPGAERAGRVVVRSIGIPAGLAEKEGIRTLWTNEELFLRRFGLTLPLTRRADTHKGTYGHVLVAAGTRQYSGAGLLASAAALRSGAGLVSWALPERLLDPMIGRLPEAMLHGMPDGGRGDWAAVPPEAVLRLAADKKALAIGPGMGRFAGDGAWLREIWAAAPCPLVADADALNMIAEAGGLDAWPQRDGAAILTPHPGEMARLTGLDTREVQRDRTGLARRYAVQHGVTLVLKGARTVTATPAGDVYVNASGNPGMATGGAGDALAGLIAGLLAQGYDAGLAAALGVYLHGLAGDRAAASRPFPGSLIAGDMINCL
ncbi:NAD(P)H-hydrate dehydratase [Paenibacillus melissococcoides]|uniref:Bifunctional NAD(P)H-hydrate repair enzyme n=1 Tax=Paenibacillus melissococcoides TaxID=2912268 RepID=A0ABN8UA52_9BACL|nr:MULTISPECIES: NAD(P)H-hydrate dehydratase [Paenibacillus]CAH8246788.1 NAD(P)H-hydrate dehydratase [Paenibacillus melissococcoides]CAH8715758.1 NAD(P)H-hydrate dehydratase [Paenibacillus melissococcoides]CAH8716714.1 NAD(P)H-hydrate dehydratase [Paenibacillus melissococcoides]